MRRVAFIREAECIGCARCLAVCPVDAIVGAHQYMHTVIARECIGCDLCLPPCPVDCIDMQAQREDAERRQRVTRARERYRQRRARLERHERERRQRRRARLDAMQAGDSGRE